MKKQPAKPVDHTVWLSSEEVAELLGETHWTVLRWAKTGDSRLMAYKVWDATSGDQGRFRFRKEDVDAFTGSVPRTVVAKQESVVGDLAPAALNGGGDPTGEA